MPTRIFHCSRWRRYSVPYPRSLVLLVCGVPRPIDNHPLRRTLTRVTWNGTRRALYFTQRAMGDASAAQRGRLGKRLMRRYVMRSLLRGLR